MSDPSVDIRPGRATPLGATLVADGVNFAVVSEAAESIELCLFDEGGAERRVALPTREHGVHCGFVPGLGAGQRYGYRAHGPFAPEQGLRFDPEVVLVDPYAREIVGSFEWTEPLGARSSLRARVAAPLAKPEAPRPRVRLAETILYELHVKGFTAQLAAVPEALRGTYAGLAHPASIEYLQALGVTTLSLLPVHYSLSERHLAPLGLVNYWGYNTLGFFCPDPRFSSTPEDPSATRAEFRAMVEALHRAGLEVVLDVVYNHTAEAGADGPTLSFRGLDNQLYYRLEPGYRASYLNWTGCGNALDCYHPRATQLILDSLRYWVVEMGVDGFRFDLAPALGRTATHFDPRAPLLVALEQDPQLAEAKLIAEPWDLGPEGYQAGRFPGRFCEWNDRFRDDIRRVWIRRELDRSVLARRLAGSSDRFHHGLRRPSASVNFITAHDGFTLADALAYVDKHNLANGENNRDGHSHEISTNCGVEGPSEAPEVLAERGRLQRALLATLLLSVGTPMLLAGDELGNSQGGNNNAYCQDNAIGWLDWARADARLLAYVREVIALRRRLPVFARDVWLDDDEEGCAPATWLRPDGQAMDVEDWHEQGALALAMILGSNSGSVALLLNPGRAPVRFVVPEGPWILALDSAAGSAPEGRPIAQGEAVSVTGQSLVVLHH